MKKLTVALLSVCCPFLEEINHAGDGNSFTVLQLKPEGR